MTGDLCQYSLIFPAWLGWAVGGAGLLLAVIGYIFVGRGIASGTGDRFSVKLPGVEASTGAAGATVLLGFLLVCLGIALLVAERHQPFARWIGGIMTGLIDRRDPPTAGQFSDETLAAIVDQLGGSGLYVVQISDAAKRERITGTYENARCYAELVSDICRQESTRLACRVDRTARSMTVCRKTVDPDCGEGR